VAGQERPPVAAADRLVGDSEGGKDGVGHEDPYRGAVGNPGGGRRRPGPQPGGGGERERGGEGAGEGEVGGEAEGGGADAGPAGAVGVVAEQRRRRR
jgi:hypothetical protein